MAGRSFALGWEAYSEWIHALWAGQVERVIAGLAQRQVDLGSPTADEPETSPKNRVAEALTYLQNQKERMRYGEYRQQGLPITSSHIESTIKQINQRVKGTERFWSSMGAEAILQLRADALSETAPLDGFWERRQEAATGQRRYQVAGQLQTMSYTRAEASVRGNQMAVVPIALVGKATRHQQRTQEPPALSRLLRL